MIIILTKQTSNVKMNILTMKIAMTRLLSKIKKNIKKKVTRTPPTKKQKKNQKDIMDYINS